MIFWGTRGVMLKNAKMIIKSNKYLIFLSIIFFAFFLLKLFPQLYFWVDDTSAFVFFVLFVLFTIKPAWYWIKARKK